VSEYTNQGISVTTQCYDCMMLDTVCLNCEEGKEARDSAIAHQLVDEGNMQYKRNWFHVTEPSGHDWTSSSTVQRAILDDEGNEVDHIMREEYKLPIVLLQDGGVYEELWELDDMRQRDRETQCPWCNIMTRKDMNDCQDCDKPLELNVR
jgi:hypothetical protein